MTAIFVVSFLLTGCDLIAALVILFMVSLIVINMLGMMWLWNISLNAISLVNLVVVSWVVLFVVEKTGSKIHILHYFIMCVHFDLHSSQLELVLNLYRILYEHFAKQKVQMKSELTKH